MAHIETWHRCPVCNQAYNNQGKAVKCRNNHPIKAESWAVGKDGKAVRILDRCTFNGRGGVNWALQEADLSDDIKMRTKQLEEGNR
ncbi:hypothetical protein [Desulfosporosinus sp. SB140]|uniref:hypothetical protein n=1 Tax=Desulfosporosinus paludis TaxID=3115649 RepID=UPI00388FAB76